MLELGLLENQVVDLYNPTALDYKIIYFSQSPIREKSSPRQLEKVVTGQDIDLLARDPIKELKARENQIQLSLTNPPILETADNLDREAEQIQQALIGVLNTWAKPLFIIIYLKRQQNKDVKEVRRTFTSVHYKWQ